MSDDEDNDDQDEMIVDEPLETVIRENSGKILKQFAILFTIFTIIIIIFIYKFTRKVGKKLF